MGQTADTIELAPETVAQLRGRGGTWALYRNEAMDSASLGHVVCIRYGEGCTLAEAPNHAPDGPYGMGWRYLLRARVDASTIPDDGRIAVNGGV